MADLLYQRSPGATRLCLSWLKNFFICMSLTCLFTSQTSAYQPRLFVWAMTDSEQVGRLDFLLPLWTDDTTHLLYANLQGEADTRVNWFAGLGMGYRARTSIEGYVGSYLFLDRNYTDSHFAYYIFSPGVERVGMNWEARLNGYIPIGKKRNKQVADSIILRDTCGENFNCEQVIFKGHQELLPLFAKIEEVGTGLDGEVGVHFGRFHQLSLYAGAYYHQFSENKDLLGVEGRAVVPIRSSFALTAEVSYDNIQHGAIVAGIRIQSGHLPHAPVIPEDHLYYPVMRNLGSVDKGLGASVVQKTKIERYEVIRDNIYFFTSQRNGTTFSGPGTGTIENPLDANQFSQATVDAIASFAPNANLYFNTGTFIINPTSPLAPNASINLHLGQSIFGRSLDFRCSAVGTERPVLLGELMMLEGNNTLDSTILTNSITVTTPIPSGTVLSLTALNIQNAENTLICNSDINALFTSIAASNAGTIYITGIQASNSQVTIHNSVVNALGFNAGDNVGGTLAAVGIGGIDIQTLNNVFTINQTSINAKAITQNNSGTNVAVGIGGIGLLANADFSNNQFSLTETKITSQAAGGNTQSGISMSTGIGSAAIGPGTSNFLNNRFTLMTSLISSEAETGSSLTSYAMSTGIGTNAFGITSSVFGNNVFDISNNQITSRVSVRNVTASIADQIFLLSSGIGANAAANVGETSSAFFYNNFFSITDSQITSTGNNLNGPAQEGTLIAGIGTNSFGLALGASATANFDGNTVLMNRVETTAVATSGSDTINFNLANVIGSNTLQGTAIFGFTAPNTITINDSSLSATARVPVTLNQSENLAMGIGSQQADGVAQFLNTNVTVNGSSLDVLAQVTGTNAATNLAVGLSADSGSVINFLTSQGLVRAIVGINAGSNQAIAFQTSGGVVLGGGNIITITSPP